MTTDQNLVNSYMDRAVEEFDVNPLATQLIRRFANQTPDLFSAAAIRHLATTRQSNAHRFLSVLILRHQQELLDYLTNPLESRQKAVHLFQRVAVIDPAFDVKLARKLPDRVGTNHHFAISGQRAARAIEVLDETSRGRRLIPILGHLVESDEPRTREKATLFIGRRVQSPAWAEKQLKRTDERVRANAVESLWGLDTTPAKELLTNCAGDKANRVAGNALIGLHIAGDSGIADEVRRMSREPKACFRSTAAWMMGKIRDGEFVPRLTELVRDEEPVVRGAALRSLIDLRRLVAGTPAAIVEPAAEIPPEAAAHMREQAAAEVADPDGGTFYTQHS